MKMNREELDYISVLEQTCNQTATACFISNEAIAFLVEPGKVGSVVGKKGENIKKLSERIGKKIEVFEYHSNAIDFIKNVFPKIKVKDASIENNKITLEFNSLEERIEALKNKSRFNLGKEILNKSFGIERILIK